MQINDKMTAAERANHKVDIAAAGNDVEFSHLEAKVAGAFLEDAIDHNDSEDEGGF